MYGVFLCFAQACGCCKCGGKDSPESQLICDQCQLSFHLKVTYSDNFQSHWYLDVTSTHKPTTWHYDPHQTSTHHSVHCDNLLLWHFDPFTFYYCDRLDPVTFYYCDTSPPILYIQVTNVHPTPPKSRTFCHCNRTSTFFYLDCDRMSTFAPKRNVNVLSQVTGDHLEAFRLFSREVDKMSQGSKSPRGKQVAVASKWVVGSEK
jgi:hypothetical protein